MGQPNERTDRFAQIHERSAFAANRSNKGGHGGEVRSFLDGIPKSALFLAGFVAADYISFKRKPKKGKR